MAKKPAEVEKTSPSQESTKVMADHSGESAAESPVTKTSTTAPSANAGAAAQGSVKIDDSDVEACYANFVRVSSSPEELVLDLGLNPFPYGTGHTVKIAQRIILNHYTAKRLLSALSMSIQRHEQAFGVLETDVRKRVRTT